MMPPWGLWGDSPPPKPQQAVAIAYKPSDGLCWGIPEARPRITMASLMAEVCERHNVTKTQLRSADRPTYLTRARFEFCGLARKHAFTTTQIGNFINRDHTTVIYALRRWSGVKACDA